MDDAGAVRDVTESAAEPVLIPIEAYPAWLAALCRHLPFAQLVAAPARLFVSPDAGAALGVLGTQTLFAAGSAVLVSIIYGIGLRRLVAQGG